MLNMFTDNKWDICNVKNYEARMWQNVKMGVMHLIPDKMQIFRHKNEPYVTLLAIFSEITGESELVQWYEWAPQFGIRNCQNGPLLIHSSAVLSDYNIVEQYREAPANHDEPWPDSHDPVTNVPYITCPRQLTVSAACVTSTCLPIMMPHLTIVHLCYQSLIAD